MKTHFLILMISLLVASCSTEQSLQVYQVKINPNVDDAYYYTKEDLLSLVKAKNPNRAKCQLILKTNDAKYIDSVRLNIKKHFKILNGDSFVDNMYAPLGKFDDHFPYGGMIIFNKKDTILFMTRDFVLAKFKTTVYANSNPEMFIDKEAEQPKWR